MAIQRALLSVSDKTGIVDLAKALVGRGVELISTGGTRAALSGAGLPVRDIAEVTGFPEMMDGRVKTLHPVVHGGLLCRRDLPEHLAAARDHGIGLIDLVVVNLYPFEQTVASGTATFAETVEQIDIGGPSMLRSAAKNHASVTVLVDPADYAPFLAELERHEGDTSLAFRQACARTVFRLTSRYDALIAAELTARAIDGDPAIAATERLPDRLALPLGKIADLRYGENPHQRAALYSLSQGGGGLATARKLHGKELSYNNLMDADAAWRLVGEFGDPACVIVKHTNPCGCALADDLQTAFLKAYEGDPKAAFGSIIAVNRELDRATAERIADPGRFVEVIIAPGFSAEALEIITTRPKWRANVRLLAAGPARPPAQGALWVRQVGGGLLVQDADVPGWDPSSLTVVSQRQPAPQELADLAFAWIVVKHLSSNAICLVKDRELVGAGAGQMSRVNASWIACTLAGARARGSVLASDAFFPFADGLDAPAAAGVTAIVQPGGSKGDGEVIAAADRHGLAMVFTGVRHFRH